MCAFTKKLFSFTIVFAYVKFDFLINNFGQMHDRRAQYFLLFSTDRYSNAKQNGAHCNVLCPIMNATIFHLPGDLTAHYTHIFYSYVHTQLISLKRSQAVVSTDHEQTTKWFIHERHCLFCWLKCEMYRKKNLILILSHSVALRSNIDERAVAFAARQYTQPYSIRSTKTHDFQYRHTNGGSTNSPG